MTAGVRCRSGPPITAVVRAPSSTFGTLFRPYPGGTIGIDHRWQFPAEVLDPSIVIGSVEDLPGDGQPVGANERVRIEEGVVQPGRRAALRLT